MKNTNKTAKMNGVEYMVFEDENGEMYLKVEEGFVNAEWLKFVGNEIEIND